MKGRSNTMAFATCDNLYKSVAPRKSFHGSIVPVNLPKMTDNDDGACRTTYYH